MAPSSVDELFQAFRSGGDPGALGAVYDRVAPELLAVAVHLVGDPALAEDVLQSTFVAAIERAETFDGERRVLPWLLGILANQARSARMRARRTPDPTRVAERARGERDPVGSAAERELADALDDSLQRVPETFRAVLVLRLRHGLSTPEIAHALGRPPGTVRSQLARGGELLRRLLPAGLAGAGSACVGRPLRGLPRGARGRGR